MYPIRYVFLIHCCLVVPCLSSRTISQRRSWNSSPSAAFSFGFVLLSICKQRGNWGQERLGMTCILEEFVEFVRWKVSSSGQLPPCFSSPISMAQGTSQNQSTRWTQSATRARLFAFALCSWFWFSAFFSCMCQFFLGGPSWYPSHLCFSTVGSTPQWVTHRQQRVCACGPMPWTPTLRCGVTQTANKHCVGAKPVQTIDTLAGFSTFPHLVFYCFFASPVWSTKHWLAKEVKGVEPKKLAKANVELQDWGW